MKYLLFLFLSFSLFLTTGCGEDDDNGATEEILNHDGNNLTGPTLEAGLHEFAARFTSNELANFQGRQLDAIRFFLGQIPSSVEVVVYGQGTINSPGAERYSRDITSRISSNGWQEHRILEDIELLDEDIWISIAVLHNQTQQSVGCDAGPAQPGGDQIFRATDPEWTTFRAATGGGESVNWNIRAVLRPEE